MITSLLLLLSLYGGNAWAWRAEWYAAWLALLVAVIIQAARQRTAPQSWPAAALLTAAYGVSLAINHTGLERLPLVLWCLAWWWWISHESAEDYAAAILQAGYLWLFLWPLQRSLLLDFNVSANIQGAWGALFAMTALGKRRVWWAVLYTACVVASGSRAALLAVIIGWGVMYWPAIQTLVRRWWAWSLPVVAGIAPLMVLARPRTVVWRWVIWQRAAELLTDHWIFGVGPGGIEAGKLITIPVDGRMVSYAHAHNVVLDWWLELGLIGLALGAVAVWWWWRQQQLPRWALACLVVLAVCGIVDDSVYMLGLAVFASGLAGLKDEF